MDEHLVKKEFKTVNRVMIAQRPPPLGEAERQKLIALGADLERAWLHPGATAATRKRILRTALTEVIVRRDGAIIHDHRAVCGRYRGRF